MRLTETILINNWVERMVVGWLEVITRANLGNYKTGQEKFKFAGKFHKPMAVATMLQIHVLLSQS